LKFSIGAKIELKIQEPDRFRTQPAQAQKVKRLVSINDIHLFIYQHLNNTEMNKKFEKAAKIMYKLGIASRAA
jgi:hypothetical protein